MITRCATKRDAATDPASRWYYEQCRLGWQRWAEKLSAACVTPAPAVSIIPPIEGL